MIKVVLDTNVIVSSILTKGSPKAIFDLAVNDRIAWFVSDPILAEYRRVLEYPRLKIIPASIRKTLWAAKKHGHLVSPNFVVDRAGEAPDNRFLECAQEARANFLVTGNLKHFPSTWKYTKIVSPAEFLLHWQIQQPLSLD